MADCMITHHNLIVIQEEKHNINSIIFMQQLHTLYLVRWQGRRCCTNIPTETSIIMNVTTTQGRRCRANIPMDVFAILYVVTTYHHRCHAGISMDEFRNINALMVQLGTSCSFDSPGLARNEPTPGKRSQGDSTPQVLSFFYECMVIVRCFMLNYAQKA